MRKHSFQVLHNEVIAMQLSQQRTVSLCILDFEREKQFSITVRKIAFGVRAEQLAMKYWLSTNFSIILSVLFHVLFSSFIKVHITVPVP